MNELPTLDELHEARILRERVRYSLTFLNVNLALIPSGAMLSCLATWDYVGGWRAVTWVSLLLLLSVLSYFAFRGLEPEEMEFALVRRLEHAIGCNSVAFGLCYGLGAYSLYGVSPVSDLAILITVNILVVGVVSGYFAQIRYAKMNIFVTLGPTILYLASQPETLYRVLCFLSLLYLLRAFGLITQYNGYFHDLNRLSFALEEEKDEVGRHYEEAERNHRDLQRSEARRHKLTQMIVHDLRTPLTSIVGHLHLIKKKSTRGDSESALNNLEKVQSLSADLVTMVSDILELSRSEDEQIPLLSRRTSWREISDKALDDLGGGQHRVRVVGELSFEGYWDTQLLRRVLVNLLTNALRFSPPGELVQMSVESDDHQVLVSIRDKGPGVPTEVESRIFDHYFSLNKEDSDTQGFGIGLYFCKLAVEKHQGQIGVRRGKGGGAEFWFRLPLQQEAAPVQLEGPNPNGSNSSHRR